MPVAEPSQVVLAVAMLSCLLVILAYDAWQKAGEEKDGFEVSPEARLLTRQAKEVFGAGPVRYQAYKARVPGADPVQFERLEKLHLSGRLTEPAVQKTMDADFME